MLRIFSGAFLLSILLIRLPPFYFFPIIKSSFLTSHSFARILSIVLFAAVFLRKDYVKFTRPQVNLFCLYLGYLLVHSMSVYGAVNFDAFLLRYKDVVFPGLFLLASFAYLRSKRDFTAAMVMSLAINFLYQAIIYLLPGLYSLMGKLFLYEGHLEFVSFNLARGRIFIETYDEAILPFLLIVGTGKTKIEKIGKRILPFLVVVPTLLSNFRSRLLMLIVSSLLIFVTWFRTWKTAIISLLVVCVLFFAADALSLRLWGFSLLDRVLLRSNYDDIQSLSSRWEGIRRSFELGVSRPVYGIGLGNYFDQLPTSTRSAVFSLANYYGTVWTSSLNPHNIFAQIVVETGILGLLYYLAMLIIFLKSDIKILNSGLRNRFQAAAVIGFWTLFSYSLFNPSTTLTYNTYFWILRSMAIYENSN